MKKILVLCLILLAVNHLFFAQLPQVINDDNQIIVHDGYTISYNESMEQPNWVRYVIKPSDLTGEAKAKRKNKFKADTAIPTGSATLADYKGSGYDRGHLKPAGDEAYDQEDMDATFLMSNMSPQLPGFNRGIWKKLENYVRSRASKSDSVIVITGGVLTSGLKTIGDNKVAVPRFFFKYIKVYDGGKIEVLPFILPNKKSSEPLYMFRVEMDMFLKFTHLRF